MQNPLDDALNFLKKLHKEIWKFHTNQFAIPPEIKNWAESARALTEQEWEDVQRIIQQFGLPCTLHSFAYGFGLYIHEPTNVSHIQPEAVLCIEDGQFPFPSAKEGFAGQERTLRVLEDLTHNKRNTELLDWCGFEPLRSPESYAY